MGADGSDQRPIVSDQRPVVTGEDSSYWRPDRSPTGTQIAFQQHSILGAPELWIANADGSDPTKIADDAWGVPAW